MNQPFCETSVEFIDKENIIMRLENLSARKVLLLATESAVSRALSERLPERLEKKFHTMWYRDCRPNPSQMDILNALEHLRGFTPDHIIALGGGSVIDFAKAMAVFGVISGNQALNMTDITQAIKRRTYLTADIGAQIIAIPTTAGSGSELTPWATIWDNGDHNKLSIESVAIKPKLALLCSELTYTMPPRLTLTTALDSAAHALEAYWSKRTNPLVQELSKQALNLSVKYLKLTLQDPNNSVYRDYLMRASTLSALAFSQTRTTSCHSISYPLTSLFGVEHGFAVAMTLGEIYKFNQCALQNHAEIDSIFERYHGVQGWLDDVCEGIATLRLSAFGISSGDIEIIVKKAFTAGRMDNNPIQIAEKDVHNILQVIL